MSIKLYGNPAEHDQGEWVEVTRLDDGAPVELLVRTLSEREEREIERRHKAHKLRFKRGGTELDTDQQARVGIDKAILATRDSRNLTVGIEDDEAARLFDCEVGELKLDGEFTEKRKAAFFRMVPGARNVVLRHLNRKQLQRDEDEEELEGN